MFYHIAIDWTSSAVSSCSHSNQHRKVKNWWDSNPSCEKRWCYLIFTPFMMGDYLYTVYAAKASITFRGHPVELVLLAFQPEFGTTISHKNNSNQGMNRERWTKCRNGYQRYHSKLLLKGWTHFPNSLLFLLMSFKNHRSVLGTHAITFWHGAYIIKTAIVSFKINLYFFLPYWKTWEQPFSLFFFFFFSPPSPKDLNLM